MTALEYTDDAILMTYVGDQEPARPGAPGARRRQDLRALLALRHLGRRGRIAGDLWTGWEFAELYPDDPDPTSLSG